MSEQYRLVFQGELVEGQHAAVVKKRLAAVLKLDDKRMSVLFSGKVVVVKKATDAKTAARYQRVFNEAGGRLRVLPVEDEATQVVVPSEPDQSSQPPAQVTSVESAAQLQVLPVGSRMLTAEEQSSPVEVTVDTDHLSVRGAVFVVDDEPEEASSLPNVDHITLAELGAMLGNATTTEVVVVEIEFDFDLAEVGAILGSVEPVAEVEAVLKDVDFEIAEPGANLDQRGQNPPPTPPDTSHIEVDKL